VLTSKSRPITAAGDVAQSADALTHDGPDAGWQADLGQVGGGDPPAVLLDDRAGLGQVTEDLADEERVAVGLRPHGMSDRDAVVEHLVPGDRLEQCHDLGVAEAVQGDDVHAPFTMQAGERVGHGVLGVEVGVPVGADDQHRPQVDGGDHLA
jgi:hypothetical protein